MELLLLGFFVIVCGLWIVQRSRNAYPQPPGPPAEPIIGHLRHMSIEGLAMKLHNWSQAYGDVMRLWIPGQNIVVLNSEKAARDLLHSRSGKYSSRTKSEVYHEMGFGYATLILPYGETLKRSRKMMTQYLHKDKLQVYYPIQIQKACALLQDLLSNPSDFQGAISRFSSSVIVKIVYGHDIRGDEDIYLQTARAGMEAVENAAPLGLTTFDYFPFLRYLPSWSPCTYYATYAREKQKVARAAIDYPYDEVRKAMNNGTATPCFLSEQLERLNKDGITDTETILEVKGAAVMFFLGGSDTTAANLMHFLLLMVLNPSVFKKAQKELDDVVGPDRLPDFNDRPSLPYLECVVQEVLRWYPTAGCGVPHVSTEDDVYEGMFIPKGTLVIPNARGMSLDQRIYRDPTLFLPERFLPRPEGYGEPAFSAFGYGRRVCPGKELGTNSVWIAVATITAAFDIEKKLGGDGKLIEPSLEFYEGIVSCIKKFPYKLTVRSYKARELIESIIVAS